MSSSNTFLLLERQVEAVTVKRVTTPTGLTPVDPESAVASNRSRFTKLLLPVVLLIVAIPLSMLPSRWRRRIHIDALPWTTASVVSAVVQGLATLVLGGFLFLLFTEYQAGQAGMEAIVIAGQTQNVPIDTGHMLGFGATYFIGFMFSPGGLLVLFLWGESLFRVIASIVADDAVGVSALWLLERISAGTRHLWVLGREGRRVVDKVHVPVTGHLIIRSCRPREWDSSAILEYKGSHYTLTSHDRSDDPIRPFVYGFRTAPPSSILRQFVEYDPRDVLDSGLEPVRLPRECLPQDD